MDLVFFVVLVGALVLVHELGHFLAARAFGVKVLTFSLGFGPPILTLRSTETTYQLGLLPFGGFVRLLEDPAQQRDGGAELAPEDRARTYQSQSLLRRVIIALAGPAMNVVVPLFLFFAVFAEGGKEIAPTIGVVIPGSPAEGVLRAGDRVLAIDGETVRTYGEIHQRITASPRRKLVFRIARPPADAKSAELILDVTVAPKAIVETRDVGVTETIGRLGIGPSAIGAAIGISGPSSPAHRAGLRTFDVVTHVGGVATPRFVDLERRLRDNVGTAVPVNYLRPTTLPIASEGALLEIAVYEAGVAVLAPEPPSQDVFGPDAQGARRAGLETTDLYVAHVPEGSSEWRAGLRPGDRITTLDGARVVSWQAFVDDLVAGGDRSREVVWTREGHPMSGLLRVRKEEWSDVAGQRVERYVFRSTHWVPTVPAPLVDDPAPLRRAASAAFAETGRVMSFLATSAVHLIQGKLTMRAISGPIAIYDVAGRAGARGAREFLWVMALVSINLGLLNLLPIPTLDGGQLLFLAIEAVTRRPVPLRVREVLSIVGLLLLVSLMAVALRNDLRMKG